MNGIIITAIICVTLVALAMIGDASKDKMIREQQHLLWRYKAMVDALLAAVPTKIGADSGRKDKMIKEQQEISQSKESEGSKMGSDNTCDVCGKGIRDDEECLCITYQNALQVGMAVRGEATQHYHRTCVDIARHWPEEQP